MADRIKTQIQFKKALWTCPTCGQEDLEDRPVGGGASYTHSCSKCLTKFNQSGSNMREYNGILTYTPEEYSILSEEKIAEDKQTAFDGWIYDIKNPQPYVEPSKEDYKNLYEEKTKEAQEYLNGFMEKATVEELSKLKTSILSKADEVQEKIEIKDAKIIVEK